MHVHYGTQVRVIARALTVPTVRDAKMLLSPERPYERGAMPGKGSYECAACGNGHSVRGVGQKLPSCDSCVLDAVRGKKKTLWRRLY